MQLLSLIEDFLQRHAHITFEVEMENDLFIYIYHFNEYIKLMR